MVEADSEERCAAGMAIAAPVEAEDELVETGLDMSAAQAVIDAERPGFEVGEDPMDPGQDDVGGHGTDDMGLVPDVLGAGIGGPAIGFGGGALGEIVGKKGVKTDCREVLDLGETDAARFAISDLDRTDDQELALGASAAAAGNRIAYVTTSGLTGRSGISLQKGIQVSDDEMAGINIRRDDFHGEWKYTISPRKSSLLTSKSNAQIFHESIR